MSQHSIVETKDQLSALIDRAMQGEDVVITRHGRPVATLRPVSKPSRPVTDADLDWLREHAVSGLVPTDAALTTSEMRDADDDRLLGRLRCRVADRQDRLEA